MEIREVILEKLKEIEEKEHVRIIYAVESGSRAWGFESTDSDYDVRFIYIREKDWYLNLNNERDVIEWQLDETLDINGWDLKKMLILLHNSNPTIFEWDRSPIVYKTTKEWDEISKILPKYYSRKTLLHHYLGTAKGTYEKFLKSDLVKLKKYFYVLRPILACEWVMDKNTIPPMPFIKLKEEYLPKELEDIVSNLIKIKKSASEIKMGDRIEVLNTYLENEIDKFKNISNNLLDDKELSWEELNDLFKKMLK